jgi:M6 family metalloprotease-like protein
MALLCFSAYAVPAKPGMRTITQADGTTITLRLIGDENFHSYVTADGLAVSRAADGNFYYRTATGLSSVVAHDAAMRSASESAFIADNLAEVNISTLAKASKKSSARRAAKRPAAKRASQVPSSGSPRVPVLLVQYSDVKFLNSDPKATFTSFFKSGSTSAYQYFYDQSNGKYTPQFDVYGPVTLSGTQATYGGNDSDGNDLKVCTMVAEACQALDGSVDFSQYDNDGDGECDVVIVLYAGVGEASSGEEDSVWPCQWWLSDDGSDYGRALTLDGTTVDKFAVFNELYDDGTKIDGIGTFCHEFSHCLDLPDFYDTEYGPHFGMSWWSLLDTGCYNNDGYTPIGYSAYEKNFMGWIDLEEATANTFYTLPVMNQKSAATDKAVKITNDKDSNEYYILENRAQQGWDKYIDAEGMMITHVTYSANAWTNNVVNNYSLQRMTIIPADGSLKLDKETYYGETYYSANLESLKGDLWPYGSATELTNTSSPAAKVNTGTYMNKPVTAITKNSDGTVSFWFMKSALPAVAAPTSLSATVESATAATISWEPGDQTDVTYTVEVSKHKDVTYQLVSSTNFDDGATGWTLVKGQTDSGDKFYLGSSNYAGSATSPSFTTDDEGKVTLIFTAKSYGSDTKVTAEISLNNAAGTAVLDKTSVSLTDTFTTYCVVLQGTPNSSATLTIANSAKKKRFYLESADIYTGDASEVASSKAPARVASDKLTFTGITDTKLRVSDLEENGTYDYRVCAVPVDTNSFDTSAWTEKAQFTLSGSTAITEIAGDNTDAAAEYFNLQGVRVVAPTAPGIYIRRQGNTATKIAL